jgi:hypothetical protein
MIRRELRRSAAACLGVCVLAGVTTTRGFAETWRWNYVMRTPNLPPLEAQSTVIVNAGTLSMRYTIPSNARQIVIEACRARLDDVAGASTMQTHGRTFLLVHLKPQHSASCGSGSRPALALPIDDTHYASEIVAAIDAACCGAGARAGVRRDGRNLCRTQAHQTRFIAAGHRHYRHGPRPARHRAKRNAGTGHGRDDQRSPTLGGCDRNRRFIDIRTRATQRQTREREVCRDILVRR